jgi:hypothetical protein
MRRVKKVAVLFLPICLLVFSGGCGSDGLVTVTGTVTLDEEPLEDAFIEFTPQVQGGSMSYGRTDASGHYEMMFSLNKMGAMPGENIVRITTADVGDEGAGNTRERVPARYNQNSELRVEVVDGKSNSFDFELTSEGEEIAQPRFDPNA